MAKKKTSTIIFIIIYATVNLVAGAVLYFLWGAQSFKEESRRRSDFAQAQQRLDQSAEMIRSLPNPAKARAEIETKIEDFKRTGLSGKQLPRIIQALSVAASEHRLKVLSIRPREDIKPSGELPAGVNKVYIEMSFECPFETLGEFTRALNDLPASFAIENFDVQKKRPQAEAGAPRPGAVPARGNELSVNMLLSTYMVWEL